MAQKPYVVKQIEPEGKVYRSLQKTENVFLSVR